MDFEKFQEKLENEYEGKYNTSQKKLSEKEKDNKRYLTCWVINAAGKEHLAAIRKENGDHITVVPKGPQSSLYKFVKPE